MASETVLAILQRCGSRPHIKMVPLCPGQSVELQERSYRSTRRRESMGEEKVRTEEYQVTGDTLVAKVKELVHEGNVRRITIRNEEGKDLIEIPLTWGVVGALLLPVLAAIGAIAALVTDCTIVVEKTEA
jgi:hypothetical protein